MDKTYWIGRKRASQAMANAAASAEARLIHLDLAGRYSVKAASCAPFVLPRTGPATAGERLALESPPPEPAPAGVAMMADAMAQARPARAAGGAP